MGLEEFMDIDDSDSSSKSSESKSTDSSDITEKEGLTQYEDGDVGPKGPYGYEKAEDYKETIIGEIDTHGQQFKYHLPIFPHIEYEEKYERGARYSGISGNIGVSCVSHQKLPLGRINREMVMLDTGQSERDQCESVLSDRFDKDIEPSTEVHLYIFAKTRHLVKMAIGDEQTDDLSLQSKAEIMKAVYGESWTQQFRTIDSKHYDFKHHNHIEPW